MKGRSLRQVLPLLLAGLLAAGCGLEGPPDIRLDATTTVPDPAGLIFWVDGLDAAVFQSLLRQGRLPNIARYLVDRGVYVRNAVASYPPITYANNVSFVTGLFPGHHGIVDNKWFDRDSLTFRDYGSISSYQRADQDFIAPTLFEMLRPEWTATILTPVRRGATRPIDNWASAGVAWYFGMQGTINRLTKARFELISRTANRAGRWPGLILAYFVTPDTVGHARGVGEAYVRMLVDIDAEIGHVCRALQRAGLLDRMVLTLVTDHGFVDVPRYLDVGKLLSARLGVASLDRGRDEAPFEQRIAHFAAARAVVVPGGLRRCAIHLRPGDHWPPRPGPEQIDAFAARFGTASEGLSLPELLALEPAVDVVVTRLGDESVRVQKAVAASAATSADGRRVIGAAVIDRRIEGGRKLYRYRVTSTPDPLGYADEPAARALLDGAYHDAARWLEATAGGVRPDAVVQLIELNDSPRAGDIMLYAADGWDFGRCDRGGHGGLLRREVVVPWVWAGPQLPAGATIEAARTVDLAPTMLDLLGRAGEIPPGLDGQSIAERLRAARPTSPTSGPTR